MHKSVNLGLDHNKSNFVFGLIGCGQLGRRHAELVRQDGRARFAGFADIHLPAAEALASTWPGSYACSQPQRLLDDPAVDAIYICTQHDSHAALTTSALSAGKHVFLEKPLALTLEDTELVAAAAARSNRVLLPGFVMRYHPLIDEARRFLPNPAILVGQMMCARWDDTKWAQDPKRGGGNVISQGCHMADLLIHLADSEPVEVSAVGGAITHPGHPCIDQCLAHIRFASGQLASWIQGDAGYGHFTGKVFVELFGQDRSVQLYHRLSRGQFTQGHESRPQVIRKRADAEQAWQRQTSTFLSVLEGSIPPPISVHQAVQATRLVMLADRAIRTGQPQRFSTPAACATS